MTLTTNQIALLFSVLVLGWLLGLLTLNGRRARLRAVASERDALRAELDAANARIAELERDEPVAGLRH